MFHIKTHREEIIENLKMEINEKLGIDIEVLDIELLNDYIQDGIFVIIGQNKDICGIYQVTMWDKKFNVIFDYLLQTATGILGP